MKHLGLPRALFLALVSSVAFWAVALGVVLAFAAGYAIGQTKTFPLGKELAVSGLEGCLSQKAAEEIVEVHAKEGFISAVGTWHLYKITDECAAFENIMVTFTKLVKAVKLEDGTFMYVYEAISGEVTLYVITSWRHQETKT